MEKKQIAVLVRNRQAEALRMSLGLLLLDHDVDVFVLDRRLENSEEVASHVETVKEMEMKLYTNCAGNEAMEYLSTEEIARRLPRYDHVLPY